MHDGTDGLERGEGATFPRPDRTEVPDRARRRPGATTRMRRATRAVAETLFTTDAGPPPAARIDWLVDELDDFLSTAGPRARLVYRACLLGVSTAAPLLVRRPPPFRSLSPTVRLEALERMERSPLALALLGAKALLCIHYYEHPDSARDIGFDGRCLVELRRVRERAPAVIQPESP